MSRDLIVRRVTDDDVDGAELDDDVGKWGIFRVMDRAPRGESGHVTSYYEGPYPTRLKAREGLAWIMEKRPLI